MDFVCLEYTSFPLQDQEYKVQQDKLHLQRVYEKQVIFPGKFMIFCTAPIFFCTGLKGLNFETPQNSKFGNPSTSRSLEEQLDKFKGYLKLICLRPGISPLILGTCCRVMEPGKAFPEKCPWKPVLCVFALLVAAAVIEKIMS